MKITQNCLKTRDEWIKEAITPFVKIDSIIELKTLDNQTILKHENLEIVFSKCPDEKVIAITPILESYLGKESYYVSSDVLEVGNPLWKLKSMEKHLIQRIVRDTIVKTLPFLEWISHEEDSVIVIQVFADLNEKSVNITVGLEGDIQVELLNLVPENKFKYPKTS